MPKYTSLFTFLTDELGYYPATAQLRIPAIKALQIVPEAKDKILNNEMSLNSLARTQKFINQMNKQAGEQAPSYSQEAVSLVENGKTKNQAFTIAEQKELFNFAASTPAQKLDEALKIKKHEIETKRAERGEQPLPPPLVIKKKYSFEAEVELLEHINELKSLLSH